jgi:serine kinase of HPr protein (carbohydrate metabolism regulator)
MLTIHAACIAFNGQGILLRGPSGSGKSDLALRAIADGARLVADDRVVLTPVQGGAPVASAPETLRGLIEIRGLGIMRMEAEPEAPIALVADLCPPQPIERLPERRSCELAGAILPVIALAPFEASAVAKLRLALASVLDAGRLLPL